MVRRVGRGCLTAAWSHVTRATLPCRQRYRHPPAASQFRQGPARCAPLSLSAGTSGPARCSATTPEHHPKGSTDDHARHHPEPGPQRRRRDARGPPRSRRTLPGLGATPASAPVWPASAPSSPPAWSTRSTTRTSPATRRPSWRSSRTRPARCTPSTRSPRSAPCCCWSSRPACTAGCGPSLPDSTLPIVALSGLVGTAFVSIMGSGLDTEFMMGIPQEDAVVPANAAMYNHWIGTIPWLLDAGRPRRRRPVRGLPSRRRAALDRAGRAGARRPDPAAGRLAAAVHGRHDRSAVAAGHRGRVLPSATRPTGLTAVNHSGARSGARSLRTSPRRVAMRGEDRTAPALGRPRAARAVRRSASPARSCSTSARRTATPASEFATEPGWVYALIGVVLAGLRRDPAPRPGHQMSAGRWPGWGCSGRSTGWPSPTSRRPLRGPGVARDDASRCGSCSASPRSCRWRSRCCC